VDSVTIGNLALDAIGTRSTIASLSENSAEAAAINLHYGPALEAVLQTARWNFARKQIILTLLKDATLGQTTPSPWLYEYAYPSDCTQGRYVMPTVQVNTPNSVVGTPSPPSAIGPAVPFLISTDQDVNGNQILVILTNQPQASLVYTSRVTNPNLFDGQFTEAFRYYLGARVCIRLTGDKAMAAAAYKMADMLCKAAAASNGNEGLTVIDNIPDWIKARGYASDWAYPDGGFFSYGPQALSPIQ
jgi:hypothetical protein